MATHAIEQAKKKFLDVVIVDTAGRLQFFEDDGGNWPRAAINRRNAVCRYA
ncbi:MAG: hypothetical protein H0A75_02025 [Candidatus Methanofishera endochildressiae]|uniref:SRP54-type proteins GTP-binding domain-containing protein n=1 Tax=Candidatus Methanofishera endochildressiae TaxID=2738884 RepID=A0A7Z0MMU8_9GAMM|nr:hypothetical protein [Candidatus Methanofishera endochildressiae]